MSESKRRITIMDGYVETFAEGFESTRGVFGEHFNATGPYEVSASRDRVIVHRAVIGNGVELDALIDSLRKAHASALSMASGDHGGYGTTSRTGADTP